ncbi:hypothetical protein XENTR_v10008397 [Xenopus tropicalis]|uniref:Uncharacterized protein LOC101734576 n=1 Tax=Xenopus tropicalis TaxID=8364 RepID=A0A8J0SIF2_XENTR|nr:uncharacterized protein LOC101734576 [Xenopus tropicalis]KAE8615064.1 hypothetical protein XENTR_v10008397 [Xenopus tropicalis]
MSEISSLLPRIYKSCSKDMNPSSLLIEGQRQLLNRSNPSSSKSLDSGTMLPAPGDRKNRAVTARPYISYAKTWVPGHKNKEVIRAHTAGGRHSVLDTNEILAIIEEKLNNSHHYVEQMFRNNDPKSKGIVSREALTRVLWSICGHLTTQQISHLLSRLNLTGHTSISFNDFKNCFQKSKVNKSGWIKPNMAKYFQSNIRKQNNTPVSEATTINQRLWDLLAERLKKCDSFHKYLPPSCLHSSGLVTFQEFKSALKAVSLLYSDNEIEDMWTRFWNTTSAVVPTAVLFRKLGLTFPVISNNTTLHETRISIEKIISRVKEKLNEPCMSMLQQFSRLDSSQTGLVSRCDFRRFLSNVNIPMKPVDTEHLLARFNLRRKDGMVDFLAFAEKLKSRSSLSFMKQMFKDKKQRINDDTDGHEESHREFLTAVQAEWRLFLLCQGPFVRLLMQFRENDGTGDGFVSFEVFKAIMEKMQIELTEEHMRNLVLILSQHNSNSLSYTKFLSLIQDRPTPLELIEEVEKLSSLIKIRHRIDKIRYHKSIEMDLSKYSHAQSRRDLQELNSVIWGLLQNKFWQFCKLFISTCRNDDCTADKEKLDSILMRMHLILLPEELQELWSSLPVTFPVEAISLQKLLKHFIRLRKPEDYGSKKINQVEMIQLKLANDIVKYWREIKCVMKKRDPRGTGQVSFKEICAVFLALKVSINPVEFDTLCQAFDLHLDGNFHYIPFLRFYIDRNKINH